MLGKSHRMGKIDPSDCLRQALLGMQFPAKRDVCEVFRRRLHQPLPDLKDGGWGGALARAGWVHRSLRVRRIARVSSIRAGSQRPASRD